MAKPATQQTTAVSSVPIRTPMTDANGNLTKPWIAFFQGSGAASDATAAATNAAPYLVPNVGGVFIPDLAKSNVQWIVLAGNATLAPPVNYSVVENSPWTLIVDQNSTGGWNLTTPTGYYFLANIIGAAKALTRSQSQWLTQVSGNNGLSAPPITDQPIAP